LQARQFAEQAAQAGGSDIVGRDHQLAQVHTLTVPALFPPVVDARVTDGGREEAVRLVHFRLLRENAEKHFVHDVLRLRERQAAFHGLRAETRGERYVKFFE